MMMIRGKVFNDSLYASPVRLTDTTDKTDRECQCGTCGTYYTINSGIDPNWKAHHNGTCKKAFASRSCEVCAETFLWADVEGQKYSLDVCAQCYHQIGAKPKVRMSVSWGEVKVWQLGLGGGFLLYELPHLLGAW